MAFYTWWHCKTSVSETIRKASLAEAQTALGTQTRSSAVAERPSDALCLSVVSFNIPTAHFLLVLVTAASDLLVHKILLNSVLQSPIVAGGVRPKPPGQTPLGHSPSCLLPFVGRLGSEPRLVGRIGAEQDYDLVSVFNKNPRRFLSYDVLRQQKTGVMTKRVVTGGRGWPPLRRITSSPSQTLRRRLVRTTDAAVCSTLAAARRGFIFHSSRLYGSRLITL